MAEEKRRQCLLAPMQGMVRKHTMAASWSVCATEAILHPVWGGKAFHIQGLFSQSLEHIEFSSPMLKISVSVEVKPLDVCHCCYSNTVLFSYRKIMAWNG